jgi:hypothetical protein
MGVGGEAQRPAEKFLVERYLKRAEGRDLAAAGKLLRRCRTRADA